MLPPALRWVRDCCVKRPDLSVDKCDAKPSYEAWAKANAELSAWNQACKTLNRIGGINTKKIREVAGKRIAYIAGIALTGQ
jgi:hypothetical protein